MVEARALGRAGLGVAVPVARRHVVGVVGLTALIVWEGEGGCGCGQVAFCGAVLICWSRQPLNLMNQEAYFGSSNFSRTLEYLHRQ